MDQMCIDFLDQVGFIVQAIKVGKMKFEFTSKNGAYIKLTGPIVENILNLSVGLEYEIENNHSLVIQTPKYMGHQLGQLRQRGNGFVFKCIGVFSTLVGI